MTDIQTLIPDVYATLQKPGWFKPVSEYFHSNLEKRLALIFRGSANLSFENSGDRVRAHLVIPSEIP